MNFVCSISVNSKIFALYVANRYIKCKYFKLVKTFSFEGFMRHARFQFKPPGWQNVVETCQAISRINVWITNVSEPCAFTVSIRELTMSVIYVYMCVCVAMHVRRRGPYWLRKAVDGYSPHWPIDGDMAGPIRWLSVELLKWLIDLEDVVALLYVLPKYTKKRLWRRPCRICVFTSETAEHV
jgi:hypothetical protein